MSEMRHYLTVFGYYAKLAIQRQLEYPLFLVSWLIMIPTQYFAGIWMLRIIVDRFQPLEGWTFDDLAFLYGLGLLSHGLVVVFFIPTWGTETAVIRGEFDRLLLRPMNVFFQFVTGYFNFIGLIDLIPGIVIFLYAAHAVDFSWEASNIVKLALVVIGGLFIRGSLYTIVGAVAFWTKRSRNLIGMSIATLERTTMYPLTLYPYAVQALLTFLFPIGFISFYPAESFLGKPASLELPFDMAVWTLAAGIVCMIVAYTVFRLGLRKYESAGS
ncbi:ABC transporter permease [Paenibacillus herberti]|uniref:ABC transporter permease n=1 Tax=Paenibacillus herberti TaxID=1619309 RepID=A0A229NXR0_9BACL|nr:ABC-2 family transporter protein [Paenibacillus herberti]OXM14627.1 ABC transporter permease [Paenibacillus herberti]